MAPLLARELLDRAGQPKWAWRMAVVAACLFCIIRIGLALPRAIHQPLIPIGGYPIATLLMTVSVCGRILYRTGSINELGGLTPPAQTSKLAA